MSTPSGIPRTPIRLVVSDVDGTLMTRDKRVTPRALDAIAAMKRAGVHFTVMSARPPQGVRRIAESLGLAGPIGAVNGGALIRGDLSIMEKLYLPERAARDGVAFLRRHGIDAWLFTESEWLLRDPAGAHVDHEARTLAMPFEVVDDFDDAHYARALKIVGASHDHALLAELEGELAALLGVHASATRSQAYYLDVTHPEAVKGNGLAGIARLLDIPIDAVMAIGDGINDISMLQRAGFAVAMGNAPDAVKGHAAAVTDDNEHEGFAVAMERFVLTTTRETEQAR